MMEKILKMTSVIASCAKAWTELFLIRRHHNQHPSFMSTVDAMMTMAGIPSRTIE